MKVSPRMRASIYGFVYTGSGVLVVVVFRTATGFAEEFGVLASVLINGLLIVVGGLVGAAVVWFRRGPTIQRWVWTAQPTRVEMRSPDHGRTLQITPIDLSWREAGRTESVAWDQIDLLEVAVGRDFLGPHRGSFWRDGLGLWVPVDSHEPVSLRFVLKRQAFRKAWVLEDGSQPGSQDDVDRLRDLVERLHRSRSPEERETRMAEWVSEVSTADAGTTPADRRLE
jgi:hypothetical protein